MSEAPPDDGLTGRTDLNLVQATEAWCCALPARRRPGSVRNCLRPDSSMRAVGYVRRNLRGLVGTKYGFWKARYRASI